VSKQYGALRPLRVVRLTVGGGDQVAIVGLDRPAAEVLINLVTGASLPDEGAVRIFDRPSESIRDGTEWLTIVDRFGIVSERAVLLEALSVVQNLSVPFSLDIEPPSESVRSRAVAAAREAGLPEKEWDIPVSQIDGSSRLRVRLARALALDPGIVLFEHPTVAVSREDVVPLGRAFRAILEQRGTAAVTMTADREFAAAIAARVLTLDPGTGVLLEAVEGWRGWFAKRR
jgi:ABC-type polar amino acid transport system ATPase subunit